MKKNRLFGLWLFLLLAAVLVACGGGESDTTETDSADSSSESSDAADSGDAEASTSDEPVVLRIGWAGSPDTLNPGTAVLSEAYTLFELVYDSMYQLELDGTYSLELADSVDVTDDGLVYTYHIRDGISFHDGEPLTAEDVAFSYNLYATQEDFPFLPVYTEFFDTVEADDSNNVIITLTDAIPNIESQLIFLYVVPEHIWGGLEGAAIAEFENEAMIGSGPFKMVEYAQNEFVRLEGVKDHFLKGPIIDEAVFQTFENQDALVQALRTGQVDMITEMPNTAVASLRNDENIELVSGPPLAPSVTDIIFNQTAAENCPPDDGLCTGHPALQDRNVRLALAHATDKQQIIDVVLLGLGAPGLTLIPDSLGVFYNDSLNDYAYDVAMANQILDDAGYLDSDGDGVREMPDGSNPLTFRMNWPSDSTNAPRMAELLAGMWAEVGVGTELQALDPDALTSVCCPTFDFDVILWGWGSDPDPSFLLSVMLTDEIPTGNSETGYSNPTYDELYLQQAVELDQQARIDTIWEMQRLVFEDVVYIIPFYAQSVQAFRTDRFTGWQTDAGKVALEDPSSLLVVEPVR
ncbi:MAG: ABC transporter substrate-binding protein [Ardenticatenaceae bacterium]|nr:ABC transporter substrate-binding protein [Ardenticatenaceae bacterium]MCB8948538.1 ABC transporter substrate-binding protein [Ardenticatenaceae bacterium]